MEARAWEDVCWSPHEEYFEGRKEYLDLQYSWLNVTAVRSVHYVGKPAYKIVSKTDDVTFDAIMGLRGGPVGVVSAVASGLGTDAAIALLRKALESPQEVAAEIGGRMMERGMSAFNENYLVYSRGMSGLSAAAKLEFRQKQVYVDLMGPAKELYNIARDDEAPSSVDATVLDTVSDLESVLTSTKALGLTVAATEVANALEQVGIDLESYAPYDDYLRAIAAVRDANGIKPCGTEEQQLTPTSIASDESAKSDIVKVRRTATLNDLPSYCRDWNTSYPEIIASRTPEDVIHCVQAGVDPNAWDRYVSPPALHVALQDNPSPSLIVVLLEAGADPNVWYGDSQTALHWSIRNEASTAVVAALLEGGADPNVRDSMGETPLHVAATYAADPAVVSFLVDAGADLGARRNNIQGRGETPLHIAAARSGHPTAIVAALLRAGADHQTKNDWGQTPLEAAMGRSRDDRDEAVVSLRSTVAPPQECGKEVAIAVKTLADMTPQEFLRCADAAGDPSTPVGYGGFTLLHWAAFANDDPAVIHALVEAGGDPNATDGFGRTPLEWAALATGNPAIVTALLESDVEPGVAFNAALLAASHGNTSAGLATFLDGGIDPHVEGQYGFTLLHVAARYDEKPSEIAALLEAGIDPNVRDHGMRTPLHLAVEYSEDPSVISILLDAGAYPNAHDSHGKTPLDIANANGRSKKIIAALEANARHDPDCYELLIDEQFRKIAPGDIVFCLNDFQNETLTNSLILSDPLHLAARDSENPEVIAELIALGLDVNVRNGLGETPLHLAAGYNLNPAVIRELINAGADPNLQADGFTPLLLAAEHGRDPSILKILLESGADPNLPETWNGETALHMAVRKDAPGIVTLLLNAGATADLPDYNGNTAMHLAARSEDLAAITAMLEVGTDPNARDKSKGTPLHDAASGDDDGAIVRALLDAGADVNARDWLEKTPLHWAAKYNRSSEVISTLIQAGADSDAEDNEGKTPLQIAKDKGRPADIIDALR